MRYVSSERGLPAECPRQFMVKQIAKAAKLQKDAAGLLVPNTASAVGLSVDGVALAVVETLTLIATAYLGDTDRVSAHKARKTDTVGTGASVPNASMVPGVRATPLDPRSQRTQSSASRRTL